MNDEKIVSNMIEYIEEKERQLQKSKLSADTQARNDAVKAILDKLEEQTNENQDD